MHPAATKPTTDESVNSVLLSDIAIPVGLIMLAFGALKLLTVI